MLTEWILGFIIILSSLGVILAKKPVHSSLSFLLTLITLSALYLQLSAPFISVMQILVYAGAILVIFMFVIVLFQDAHHEIDRFPAKSYRPLLILAATAFSVTLAFLGYLLFQREPVPAAQLSPDYGTVQALGYLLYVDFFFPFEAVVVIFLIAVVGAYYIARRN